MNKAVFYLWATLIIVVFSPFYLIGATFGVFVGCVYRGHEWGMEFIRELSMEIYERYRNE